MDSLFCPVRYPRCRAWFPAQSGSPASWLSGPGTDRWRVTGPRAGSGSAEPTSGSNAAPPAAPAAEPWACCAPGARPSAPAEWSVVGWDLSGQPPFCPAPGPPVRKDIVCTLSHRRMDFPPQKGSSLVLLLPGEALPAAGVCWMQRVLGTPWQSRG